MRGYHASTAICRPVNFYHRGSRSLERSKYHPRSSSPPHLSRSPSVHHKFSLRAFSRQLRRFSSRVVPTPSMLLERIRLAKKMEEKKDKNNFCKGCCRPVTERLVSDMQIWRCLPSRNAARVSCIDTRGLLVYARLLRGRRGPPRYRANPCTTRSKNLRRSLAYAYAWRSSVCANTRAGRGCNVGWEITAN